MIGSNLTIFSMTVTTLFVALWALFKHSPTNAIDSSMEQALTVEPGLKEGMRIDQKVKVMYSLEVIQSNPYLLAAD